MHLITIMHEMSLAMNIVDIALKTAKQSNAEKINAIEIEVGTLAGVMTDALTFCLEAASKNTAAEHAVIEIIKTPGKARCQGCNMEFNIQAYFEECPDCGEFLTDIIQGKDLRVLSITVDEEENV